MKAIVENTNGFCVSVLVALDCYYLYSQIKLFCIRYICG
jgi:hypothetical protein